MDRVGQDGCLAVQRTARSSLIDGLEFTSDRDSVIAELESAVDDVQRAIAEMRAGERMTEHYGG